MRFTIDVNVNFPGLSALLSTFQGLIMTKLEELQASTDALAAKVEEANGKTDALILAANQTKDALVALQGTITSGGTVSDADLQAIIDKQAAVVASLTTQEAETDAATTAVAP